MEYSVLMAVYHKEKSEYLEAAVCSMLNQTVPCRDFVLVCDGPLNEALDAVIAKYENHLTVHRLPVQGGLANALREGLPLCHCDLVARMDSDDIAKPDRCEKQLRIFEMSPGLALAGGAVAEFEDNPDAPFSYRVLPSDTESIRRFSKKRNPFNHPTVMFRRESVLQVGGYSERYPLYEDFDLWVRLLRAGYTGENTQDVLVCMRTPSDLYKRRGGWKYFKTTKRFYGDLKKSGYIGLSEYFTGGFVRMVSTLLPNFMRKWIYQKSRKQAN